MIIYNKLIRDKILEILNSLGKKHAIRTLTDDELQSSLIDKLHEELAEFKENPCVEELADIIEVIYSLGKCIGVSKEEIEEVRGKKAEQRGSFNKKIFLIEAEK